MKITFSNGREPIEVDADKLSEIRPNSANLSNLDLSGFDFHGSELENSDLRYCDLHCSELSGCHLSNSNLHGSDMQDCVLTGADLRGCDLSNCNLSDADLRDSNLQWCNLTECELTNTDLRGANLDYASLPLSCYILDAKVDKRLAVQLLYYACRWLKSVDDEECEKFLKLPEVKALANQFHHIDECGEI